MDLLPATIGNPVDRTRGEAARVGGIEYGHPVFETFRAPRSGDFLAVRVYSYRNLGPVTGAQVLARFDAGAPAVVERRVGAGRVLMWASTLDQTWTDLPIRPLFLPFIHRAATHLVAYVPSQPWATVGQILDTSRAGAHKGQSVPTLVLTPSGTRLPVSGDGTEVIELAEQGFYELRGDANSTSDMAVVASNVDPAEADLTAMDPQDVVAASTGESQSDAVQAAAAPQTPESRERSQRLWWYLLCLGAALLAAETFVSNRLKSCLSQPQGVYLHPDRAYPDRKTRPCHRPAPSNPHGGLMLEHVRRSAQPTELLDIIAQVRRRWRMKLALRGAVWVVAVALLLVARGDLRHRVGALERIVHPRRRASAWPSCCWPRCSGSSCGRCAAGSPTTRWRCISKSTSRRSKPRS